MVGGNTLRTDHPQLTVRDPENWERQPRRIIVSSSMDEELVGESFPDGRFEVAELPDADAWDEYLKKLGSDGVSALLIEGGGELAAAALDAGAVDYVEFHIAPKLLGGRNSIPVLGGESPDSMEFARKLKRVKVFNCGDDVIISGYLREL